MTGQKRRILVALDTDKTVQFFKQHPDGAQRLADFVWLLEKLDSRGGASVGATEGSGPDPWEVMKHLVKAPLELKRVIEAKP